MAGYEFATMTGRVIINYNLCKKCSGKPCVEACEAGVLGLQEGQPVLIMAEEKVKKGKCNECLACELECHFRGAGGLTIDLPVPEYEQITGGK